MSEANMPATDSLVAPPAHPDLHHRCETRRDELEAALASLGADGAPQTRHDLEAALDALRPMLTGDLDHIPSTVADQLARWLESSKYLGLKETREMAAAEPAAEPPPATEPRPS